MKRKPGLSTDSFSGAKRILRRVFAGSLLLAMIVVVYFLSLREGHTQGEVRAIAFSSLIIGNAFLTLTNLSKTRSLLAVFAERNWAAMEIVLSSGSMMLLILSLRGLLALFNFEFQGYRHFLPAVLVAFVSLMTLEVLKYYRGSQQALGQARSMLFPSALGIFIWLVSSIHRKGVSLT